MDNHEYEHDFFNVAGHGVKPFDHGYIAGFDNVPPYNELTSEAERLTWSHGYSQGQADLVNYMQTLRDGDELDCRTSLISELNGKELRILDGAACSFITEGLKARVNVTLTYKLGEEEGAWNFPVYVSSGVRCFEYYKQGYEHTDVLHDCPFRRAEDSDLIIPRDVIEFAIREAELFVQGELENELKTCPYEPYTSKEMPLSFQKELVCGTLLRVFQHWSVDIDALFAWEEGAEQPFGFDFTLTLPVELGGRAADVVLSGSFDEGVISLAEPELANTMQTIAVVRECQDFLTGLISAEAARESAVAISERKAAIEAGLEVD